MTKANECTCPSGDGSLAHPCPAHPAVEQAGGDERAAQWHECTCPKIGEKWNPAKHGKDCPVHQARASLAQPSPAQARSTWPKLEKPAQVGGVRFSAGVSSRLVVEAAQRLYEFESTPEKEAERIERLQAFREQLDPLNLAPHAKAFNEAPAEALKPEQAEAERPEVVAVMESNGAGGKRLAQRFPIVNVFVGDELMTVAQHERIVGALRFERQQMDRAFTACINERDAANARLHEVATACATAEQERDAALARVAELEAKLSDPTAVHQWQFSNAWFDGSEEVVLKAGKEGSPIRTLYTAPPAQAQQLHDLDKQCRDDVARALGLRPSQERGFAWSYLLASIKSCVKASEDAAQAQHSVPEEFSFEYRHPNGECHTVTVSREQVINEMPDFLFEALCSKFCNCEPVGETNVVECCCDEYAEEFKLIAAAPGKEGV